MAKKSQKRPVRHERNQSGCMWGFISMFDFRHGRSNQKLLADRRRGPRHIVAAENATSKSELLINLNEKNCQGTVGGEGSTTIAADVGKPSVKKLMEDELFFENDSNKETNCAQVEPKQSKSEYGSQKRKSRKRTSRSRTKSCEIDIEDLGTAENLELDEPCLQTSDKKCINSIDMDDVVEEFCHQIHRISCLEQDEHSEVHDQPNLKHHDVEEKLREAIELFIRHKLINGKHGKADEDIHPSKELNDALKILSSDEELYPKLLQSPKSIMVKYIEKLLNTPVERDEVSKSLVQSNLSKHEIHVLKQTDEVSHSKHRKFFRRKSKSLENPPSAISTATQASSNIVILKPGPAMLEKPETEYNFGPPPESRLFIQQKGPDERVGSHFSFSEIKRKLKQAMGKEQQEIRPDVISMSFPDKHRARAGNDKRYKEIVGRNSPNKDHFFIEKIARPSVGNKRGENSNKSKECETIMEHETANRPSLRLSNIYVEAKKHLSEMVSSENSDVEFSSRHVPKTLGRILSLPEYNFSPLGSPGRDWTQGSQMRFSASDKFQKQENNVSHLGRMTQNSDSELCTSDESTNNKAEGSIDATPLANEVVQEIEVDKSSCPVDGAPCEGDVEIIEVAKIAVQEAINLLDSSLSEPGNSSMTRDDQIVGLPEYAEAKGDSECLIHDSDEEIQRISSPLMSPSSSSITKKDDDMECAIEVSDRPSPVSVLEPLFTEDDISPAGTRFQHSEISLQPLRIQFEDHGQSSIDLSAQSKTCTQDKESVFQFIKVVLEASELSWDEFYIMSNSADPLLDPSLHDEVGFFPNELCYDKQLLFDCVNEVLMEVYERYFGFPLGLSFGKRSIRPVPDIKWAIHEVWQGVYWYLLPLPLPHTLEQIVKKDMAKTGSWMDLHCDTEATVIEIGESVFIDLIEETMLSCVNESQEDGKHLILVEESNNGSSTDL